MKKEPKMFVRAAPGRRVKDPISLQVLTDEGEEKPANSYWNRRLLDGDVIEGHAPKVHEPKPRKDTKEL